MGVTRVVVLKELLLAWRDRSVIILVLLVPLALAGITSLAFGSLGSSSSVTLGVVDLDGGDVAAVLTDEVLPSLRSASGDQLVELVDLDSEQAARDGVTGESVAAAIIVPAGFSDDVRAGSDPQLQLLAGADDTIGVPVAQAVLAGFTGQISTNRLSVLLATTGTGATEASQELVTRASAQRSPVEIVDALTGTGTVTAPSFFAPSMLILSLFFCGQTAARGLVAERRDRTLARIVLSPVPVWKVLLAKALAAFLLAAGAAIVLLGTFAAIGSRFGPPAVLALLVLASAAAMISVAVFVVMLARDEEQAGSLGTVVAFALAILGGNFIPLSQAPPLLDKLSLLTPNGWALRGFADLSVTTTDGLSTVAPSLIALVGFALAAGVPALLLARRNVRRAGV